MLAWVACKRAPKDPHENDTITSGLIRIACDENFKSLMDAEIAVFEGRNTRAAIIPIYTNETDVFRLLTEDSVRFALVTRDVTSKERAALKEKQLYATPHLVGFDGVALLINTANKDTVLDLPTLKKILRGEVTEWSQMNPRTQLGAIRVVVDNTQSGILRYVADSIAGTSALTPNIYGMKHPAEVVAKVQEMPNTIGLISYNAYSDTTKNIRLMRINGYLPYAGDLMQANYPLWRPVYAMLTDPKRSLPSGLSVFLSQEIGQRILMKAGLLPITDPQNRDVVVTNEYPK
ncbi:phosphate ABC transporter substrate-binding protein [Bacteroidia bacterium]|nr:phosphate ABC transporter substrate-binding protein [Bacteroidia bacterium]